MSFPFERFNPRENDRADFRVFALPTQMSFPLFWKTFPEFPDVSQSFSMGSFRIRCLEPERSFQGFLVMNVALTTWMLVGFNPVRYQYKQVLIPSQPSKRTLLLWLAAIPLRNCNNIA